MRLEDTPKPKLLNAIPVLPVLSIERAVAFYQERLGFRPLFVLAAYAGLTRDRVELHLWQCTDPELPRVSSCRLLVTRVDALYAELSAQGVIHPKGPLEEKPWGTREFVALDLDGNALRFAEEIEPGLA